MAYTPEEIRMLLERHELALARHRQALGAWDWVADHNGLDADVDKITARLPDSDRRAVGEFLEAWVEAQERHAKR
jgi:hypothetical protein